jgi:hypothetical protein
MCADDIGVSRIVERLFRAPEVLLAKPPGVRNPPG